MLSKFIVGNSYSIKEIKDTGLINTEVNDKCMHYRKAKTLMTFGIPRPFEPRKYKLLSIKNLLYCITSFPFLTDAYDIMDTLQLITF